MKRKSTIAPMLPLALAAALTVAPAFFAPAFAQAPGNPPGSAPGSAGTTGTAVPGPNTTVPEINRGAQRSDSTLSPSATGQGSTSQTTSPGTLTPSTAMPATPPSTATLAAPVIMPADSVTAHRPRVSQLVGTTVYNDRGETVGEVDDIILSSSVALDSSRATGTPAGQPTAVIQVGGFLGMGGRLVSVSLSELHWNAERQRIVMPNATKELLQGRPAFNYDTLRRG